MRYEFHPEALAEYEEAVRYYAGRQEGLDLRFIACVEAAVHQVAAAPERWRLIDQDVRRCLTKVFPYAILYTIEPDYVLIVAVMHCHREPGYWRRRVVGGAEPDAAPNGGPATQPGNSGVTEGPPSVS
jgi:plasmid stabilization system protein ParE